MVRRVGELEGHNNTHYTSQYTAIRRTLSMITPRSCHCTSRHKPILDITSLIIMRLLEPVLRGDGWCHRGSGQTSSDVGELEIQILIGLNGFLFHQSTGADLLVQEMGGLGSESLAAQHRPSFIRRWLMGGGGGGTPHLTYQNPISVESGI